MHRRILIVAALAIAGAASAQAATPQANAEAPSNAAVKDSDVERSSVAAGGANSFTAEQAQGRIAKAGYSKVTDLTKDDAGLWQAKAMKRGKPVNVALDYKGNVISK